MKAVEGMTTVERSEADKDGKGDGALIVVTTMTEVEMANAKDSGIWQW